MSESTTPMNEIVDAPPVDGETSPQLPRINATLLGEMTTTVPEDQVQSVEPTELIAPQDETPLPCILATRDAPDSHIVPLHERLSGKGFHIPIGLMRRQSKSMKHITRDIQVANLDGLSRVKTLGSLPTTKHEKVLNKLGINEETMRIEKGMKKLGICDHDIQASIDIRRHCGVILNEPATKEEVLLGFSAEQLKRIKAVKTMGTSENEILDTYCKQMSNLGVPNEVT